MTEISVYKTKEQLFKVFCNFREWTITGFYPNPKNKRQYLGECYTSDGERKIFLISENGKYFLNVGPRQWEPYDYQFKREEGTS